MQGGLGGHSPDVVAGYCGLHEATRPGPLAQQLMFIMFVMLAVAGYCGLHEATRPNPLAQ